MMTSTTETIEKLEKLGFKKASEKIKTLSEKKRKLMIAYEHYRFVRKEKIYAFNQKLEEETKDKDGGYKTLSFSSIENYEETPPMDVLMALESAQERGCFDTFEIAHIVQVKDPI